MISSDFNSAVLYKIENKTGPIFNFGIINFIYNQIRNLKIYIIIDLKNLEES